LAFRRCAERREREIEAPPPERREDLPAELKRRENEILGPRASASQKDAG
jgi:hypothetical protein